VISQGEFNPVITVLLEKGSPCEKALCVKTRKPILYKIVLIANMGYRIWKTN
jgi:hypothetical protein